MHTPLRALHAPSIVHTEIQARASSVIADGDRAHPSRGSSVDNRQRHKPRRATVLVITPKGRESDEPVPIRVTSQRSEISISFARRMDRPWPAGLYCPKRVAVVTLRPRRRIFLLHYEPCILRLSFVRRVRPRHSMPAVTPTNQLASASAPA